MQRVASGVIGISDARQQIEALFRRYAKGVGGYVVARTGDEELAEEITARVFELVVRKWHQCTGSPAAWLWTIVRNELRRYFRDRRAHVSFDDSTDGQAGEGDEARPIDRLLKGEVQCRLHSALKALPEEEHEVVFMKFFQNMTSGEIAAATGKSANHVAVRIHRTLKKLRGLMEGTSLVQGEQPRVVTPWMKQKKSNLIRAFVMNKEEEQLEAFSEVLREHLPSLSDDGLVRAERRMSKSLDAAQDDLKDSGVDTEVGLVSGVWILNWRRQFASAACLVLGLAVAFGVMSGGRRGIDDSGRAGRDTDMTQQRVEDHWVLPGAPPVVKKASGDVGSEREITGGGDSFDFSSIGSFKGYESLVGHDHVAGR